jgi:AcrR family transcriptional regulator
MARTPNVTQEAILQAALELVQAEGERAVTLGAVAAKLGIKTPSLYNHVAGLAGLRRLLALHGLAELRRAMLAADRTPGGDVDLFAMAIAYVQFARANPGLYASLFIPKEWQDEVFHSEAGKTVDVVVQALRPYTVDAQDAVHVVRGLRSLLHGFASLEAADGFGMPVLPDASLHRMIEIYLNGV